MSAVFPVDKVMLEDTKAWLMSQRSSNGFKRNPNALDSFGRAPDDTTKYSLNV